VGSAPASTEAIHSRNSVSKASAIVAVLAVDEYFEVDADAVRCLEVHDLRVLEVLEPLARGARGDHLGGDDLVVEQPAQDVDLVHGRVLRGHRGGVRLRDGEVRQAMDHLVELAHRRIVHIDGGRGPGSAERRRAYRAAMRRHGLESEARVIPGDHTELSGIETGKLLLAERDRGQHLPTAVLAGNDRCAGGLLMSLMRAGVDVPRDMSVVGYDDSHLSHLMPIGLTTVRQDAVLMAEHAVRFAVERLEGGSVEPREAVLDPKLVVRGTSGPAPDSQV
jgi:hypothetical protein